MEKDIPVMQGTIPGGRCTQGRKTTHGLDGYIKTWTGLPVEE